MLQGAGVQPPSPRTLAAAASLDPAGQGLLAEFAGYEKRKAEWRHFRGYLLGSVEPRFLLGRKVRVYWPDDSLWYSGEVAAFNPYTLQHTVRAARGAVTAVTAVRRWLEGRAV